MNGREDDDNQSDVSDYEMYEDYAPVPPLQPLHTPPPAVRRLDFGYRVIFGENEDDVPFVPPQRHLIDEGFEEPEPRIPVPTHRQESPPAHQDPPMEVSDDEGHFGDLELYPTSRRLLHRSNDYAQEGQDQTDGLQKDKETAQRISESDALTDEEYRVLLHQLSIEEAKKRNPLRYGLLPLSNPEEPASQLLPVAPRRPRTEPSSGFSFNPSPSASNPEPLPSTSGYSEEDARRASERFEEEMFKAIEESKNRKRKREEE
ncbi:hypothetical protein GCK72_007104 [Caenorhabditis remanei]|uniref:Uncharacterized protein n=1 Tax=Caenorhabditis remanei TaxID=31234 RepID=A0A6A5HI78_CAERE|nr:hypothetical protein GCK72_007104 [Caenorhabditis remanei]KAF1767145.1 hypothetical protein GCK72_007104 [Caenorhabditis remanei]